MRLLALTAAAVIAAQAEAQSAPSGLPIVTDRPSFSDAPFVIPRGHWQIESGLTFTDLGRGRRLNTYGESLVRMPVSERLELRLLNVTYGQFEGSARGSGLQDLGLGVKWKLLNARSGRPDLALLLQATVDSGADAFRTNRAQPTAKLAFYFPTDAKTGIGGNLNLSDLGPYGGRYTQYAASLYVSRTFDGRTSGFLETFRVWPVSKGGPNPTFVNTGVLYLLNPRTQIDVRIATALNRPRDGWFVGAGVSYRF
ncbi:MAG: transporter [Fimbriimonadaceae bacterium]|nr:transporter [Fimbriimonadaceae bacterium]